MQDSASSSLPRPYGSAAPIWMLCQQLTLQTFRILADETFMLRLANSLTALTAVLMAALCSLDAGPFAALGCCCVATLFLSVSPSCMGANHTTPLHPRIMVRPAQSQGVRAMQASIGCTMAESPEDGPLAAPNC